MNLMNLIKLLLTVFTVFTVFTVSGSAEAAFGAFKANKNLPAIVICGVKSFGEDSLKQESFDTFEELLEEQLQNSKKLRVERKLKINPVLADGSTLQVDPFLDNLHMNAIVNGKEFEPEKADPELIKYYRSHKNKQPNESAVYYVDESLRERVREFGRKQNADYLLFCNLKSVDISESNGSVAFWAASASNKKIAVDMDFYLVNPKNCKVFEGTSFVDKSCNRFSVPFVKIGKEMTVEKMLHDVLEKQAQKVVKTILKTGLKGVADDAES